MKHRVRTAAGQMEYILGKLSHRREQEQKLRLAMEGPGGSPEVRQTLKTRGTMR